MSEYQYYEFRALDRRLTAEQQQRLRSLSSRAEISATRLASEYSFGNFRGDPGRLLEEYFDAYLYAANRGMRELAFRLPRALLDAETAQTTGNDRDDSDNRHTRRNHHARPRDGPSPESTIVISPGQCYRTSSPVTARPMIIRWISDVPSKIVKLVEVRAVSAGRRPADPAYVSTNSAPIYRGCLLVYTSSRRGRLTGAIVHADGDGSNPEFGAGLL